MYTIHVHNVILLVCLHGVLTDFYQTAKLHCSSITTGISIEAYRAAIGLFSGQTKDSGYSDIPYCPFRDNNYFKKYTWKRYNLFLTLTKPNKLAHYAICNVIATSLIIQMLISLSGNVHPNPGPDKQCDLSICHANIRSLKAIDRMTHISCELALKYDIITLSETWLSNTDPDQQFLLNDYQVTLRRDRLLGAQG